MDLNQAMGEQQHLNEIYENQQRAAVEMEVRQTAVVDNASTEFTPPQYDQPPADNQQPVGDLNGNKEIEDGEKDKNDEEEVEQPKEEHLLFQDSSHQYLIYYGHPKDHPSKSFNGMIMGFVALLIEYTLLSFILAEGQKLLREDLLPVMVPFGQSCNESNSYSNFECDAEVGDGITSILAPALLAIFLMSDTVIALKGIFIAKGVVSKIGSIALFIVSCYACYVGGLFAYQGMWSGSSYDAIVNCVGVLFICDIDEKAYATFKAVESSVQIEKFKNWACCQCKCCKDEHKVKYCIVFCCVIFLIMASLPAILETSGTYDSVSGDNDYPSSNYDTYGYNPSPAYAPSYR